MFGFPRIAPPTPTAARKPALGVERLEERDVPTTFAVADTYNVEVGRVLTVPVNTGVLANDFNDVQPGAILTAQLNFGPFYVDANGGTVQPNGVPFPPLPAGSLTLTPNGSFTFLAPSDVPFGATQVRFLYQATNPSNGETAIGQVTIRLDTRGQQFIAVGADGGGGPHVRVYETGTNALRFNFFPYEAAFTGGVRVAVGDVNTDGVDDIVTIPGPGGAPRVRVFSGVDGDTLVDTFAFNDAGNRAGGYVAVGDINGDGRQDIIVGAGEGGGPRVTVLSYNANAVNSVIPIANFFAYDSSVRSGVRVAAGNLAGGFTDSLVTAPGQGGGPQVNVYNGSTVAGKSFVTAAFSFFATDSNNRDGVNIATGNLRGDGLFDIITGNGAGAGVVRVFDGRTAGLIRQLSVPFEETPAGGGTQGGPGTFNFQTPANGTLLSPTQSPGSLVPGAGGAGGLVGVVQGGVRVAATDYNSDGLDDIVTGGGPGNVSRVRVFDTKNNSEITNLLAFTPTFLGGVNVAASTPRRRR